MSQEQVVQRREGALVGHPRVGAVVRDVILQLPGDLGGHPGGGSRLHPVVGMGQWGQLCVARGERVG